MTEIKPWEDRDQGLYGEFRELRMYEEIAELRAALAKSQPVEPVEPVAYMWHGHMGTGSKSLRFSKPSQWDYINAVAPLFTHPVRPMSDEDIVRIYEEVSHQKLRPQDKRIVFEVARAIEAHIKGATE